MKKFDTGGILSDADALIVIPPFAFIERPSIAAHLLQACAKDNGFNVRVIYANLVLAAGIGETNYAFLARFGHGLLSEKFFAAAAYRESSDIDYESDFRRAILEKVRDDPERHPVAINEILLFHKTIDKWINDFIITILDCHFRIVGFTNSYDQTSSTVAFLNRLKAKRADIITIVGGANCEGEMAEGMLGLTPSIDYVFSGESEETFVNFLGACLSGDLPDSSIIYGAPFMNLDDIPVTDYSEYYEQLNYFIPGAECLKKHSVLLPYETSRGCWKGEKRQCLFCGLNGKTLTYRVKSPDKVIGELKQLLKQHPTRKIVMVDNIMPLRYLKSLVPKLPEALPDIELSYEIRSNLTLKHFIALRKAGIKTLQPGIESLSSSLLKRMKKGVSARQNISCLRYARSLDISIAWNMLYAFPGDTAEEYWGSYQLIPLIHHFEPPSSQTPISIERFSPYFDFPEKYGRIYPWPAYESYLPPSSDISRVAYHFLGDYDTCWTTNSDLLRQLRKRVEQWRQSWSSSDTIPKLELNRISNDQYLLVDTRNLPNSTDVQIISLEQALGALVSIPLNSKKRFVLEKQRQWAVEQKLIVKLDSWYVSLVTADPELILEFEAKLRDGLVV